MAILEKNYIWDMETSSKPAHIGRKISRIRELRNMKQDTLAFELGVSKQTVSRLEASESVEDEMLEKVVKVLGVLPEGLKIFLKNLFFKSSTIHFKTTAPTITISCAL